MTIKFNESEKYPAYYNERMIGLKDGFEIEKINFHNDFQNGWTVINLSPTLTRNKVHPVGVFDVIISREGSC